MVKLALFSSLVLALSSLSVSSAIPAELITKRQSDGTNKWSTIWATAPQLVEPANLPPQPFNISGAVMANTTLRQTIKVTLGASQIRLRFSNMFSLTPLTLDSVAVALTFNNTAGVASITRNSLKTVRFNGGQTSVTIPKAALAVSDPLDFAVTKGQVLSITIYYQNGISGGAVTGHPGSRTDSWLTFGNQVKALNLTGSSLLSTAHWYSISGVEGWVPKSAKYLSILGDSITDGRGSTTNQNNRWPDVLSASLGPNSQVAFGNQGLGGNCVLSECLGFNAVSRIDRDVLAQSGVTHAMIFEGVNDIGGGNAAPDAQKAIGDNLINAFKQFITRAHAAGLPAIGATITPFGGSFYDEATGERLKTRSRVNDWIKRTSAANGGFDYVADFDAAVRDPKNTTALKKEFDSGDGLHPSVAAYTAFAAAFPVAAFA